MSSLEYVTNGGYQYRQNGRTGRVVRVPRTDAPRGSMRPKVGQSVKVIVKPYASRICVSGRIVRVLTKKAIHTRGHKVRLEDGTVGRVVA